MNERTFAGRFFRGITSVLDRFASRFQRVRAMTDPKSSYYPEFPRKSKLRIIWDLTLWLFRYKELNKYYTLYGFDIAEPARDMSQYQNYRSFMADRAKGNKLGQIDSQVVLLRDKYLFYKYMTSFGMPVPTVFAARIRGAFTDADLNELAEGALLVKEDFFAKAIDGECGLMVGHIKDHKAFLEFIEGSKGHDLIFQERVEQHPEMNRLFPGAVNTIRIVTVLKRGQPEVFSSLLRIGTTESGDRDNTSQGGIAVGIMEDGTLMKYGFRKPQYGGRIDHHPDTGVSFSSFRIPYYQEAIEMACRAHKLFYRVKSIGWDIAVAQNGCLFIEGNDNWELQSFQGIYGGLKEKCTEFLLP